LIAGIRSHLPHDWEWHFVDGEDSCDPAEGVDGVYAGPYLAYYTLPSLETIAECHEWLDDIIDEMGPFDIIIGYSQYDKSPAHRFHSSSFRSNLLLQGRRTCCILSTPSAGGR
jgi:hypothetical protein